MDNLINDLLEWEEIDISFLEKPEEFLSDIEKPEEFQLTNKRREYELLRN